MLFSLFALFISFSSFLTPEKVLVVGGGPAGLATAIEAKQNGFNVTIVEKRDAYTRLQWLLLDNDSLALLDKWQVDVSEMSKEIQGEKMAFIPIKLIEEKLEKRALACGIKKVYGEFIDLKTDHTAHIRTPEGEQFLSYDILVGADGTHSRVRQDLDISLNQMGKSKGAAALIRDSGNNSFDLSPIIKQESYTLRKITFPNVNLIMMQSPITGSREQFEKMVRACDWVKEADTIQIEKALIIADIPVTLQQAQTFSNPKKSAIIIGDAAASASFFEGLGANTAFKTAALAGKFFKDSDRKSAYNQFNEDMKATTDAMIAENKYLFE